MKKIIIAVVVVTAVIGLMTLFVDVIPPKAATVSAMTETFVRIALYAKQSNSIPQSLAVLPKRAGYANQTTDAWKRPLRYEIATNGIIKLTSLGKDGMPGGTGDDADISKAYHALRPDGTLWATSEMWIVDAEISEEKPQPSGGSTSTPSGGVPPAHP